MDGTLAGQSAIVTGAARGIGAAIATELIRAGASLVINDINEDALAEFAATLPGDRVRMVAGSVTDLSVIDTMVEDATRAFGKLDLLVNNAGITGPIGAFDTSEEELSTVLQTNVIGPFMLSKRAGRAMQDQGKGAIVNLASTASTRATRVTPIPAYDASKGAIASLTRALAVEWAPLGIRVNAVAPGPLATKMSFPLPPEMEARKLAPIPMGRRGVPEEVAGAVVFLASDAARYITGQVLRIDGGMSA